MAVSENRGRITATVTPAVAVILKEAAALTGSSVNQFLVQAAVEKANHIIDREHFIKVTRADAEMLIRLLENPSKPNAALARAFDRHKKRADDEQARSSGGPVGEDA